ncbi:MAG: ABC transporter permease, partial [Lachnospiraceae bacterium]|nr:ABC transporter permease [Lachnospiraceae bacterium]
ALVGTVGAAIPLLLLYVLYQSIVIFVSSKFASVFGGGMQFLNTEQIFSRLVPISFGIGIGIGLLGTWLTLKRQLRKFR